MHRKMTRAEWAAAVVIIWIFTCFVFFYGTSKSVWDAGTSKGGMNENNRAD